MATFQIPLSPQPESFSISLGGVQYNLRVTWCTQDSAWILDIADANDVPIVRGIPLIPGVDLLEQYAYLGIGGMLIMRDDANPNGDATFTNLGVTSRLFFVTP